MALSDASSGDGKCRSVAQGTSSALRTRFARTLKHHEVYTPEIEIETAARKSENHIYMGSFSRDGFPTHAKIVSESVL